jgi:hypothetical protein
MCPTASDGIAGCHHTSTIRHGSPVLAAAKRSTHARKRVAIRRRHAANGAEVDSGRAGLCVPNPLSPWGGMGSQPGRSQLLPRSGRHMSEAGHLVAASVVRHRHERGAGPSGESRALSLEEFRSPAGDRNHADRSAACLKGSSAARIVREHAFSACLPRSRRSPVDSCRGPERLVRVLRTMWPTASRPVRTGRHSPSGPWEPGIQGDAARRTGR